MENVIHTIYRVPGLGADNRLFSEIEPIEGHQFVDLEWELFPDIKSLKDYAVKIAKKIDITQPFSLLGVSMGGMVCTELADILHPEKVVIISSAKTSGELPSYFKRFKYLGVTSFLRTGRIKFFVENSSKFFGAMNSEQKQLFNQMVENINMDFVVWSIKAILNWDKKYASPKIIHIHGTKDFVLPISFVQPTVKIKGGDHMMIWNKADLINHKLKEIFLR